MRRKVLAALLAATLAAGVFVGCGNKSEGDGRIQAAVADDGNGSSLASEAPKSVPEITAEPTAEPASKTMTGPTAEPAPKITAEPTAEPASKATAEPTAEPAPKATAVAQGTAQSQGSGNTTAQAQGQAATQGTPSSQGSTVAQGITTQAQTASQQPAASTKPTDDTAEPYTAEFLELLNADRRAAGLPEVSGGADYLEAQALKRVIEIAAGSGNSVGGGANFESFAQTNEDILSNAYEDFKATEGTWNCLMATNLESVSVARYGNTWVLEGHNSAVIIDANHPAPEGYVPEDPTANMTTEEAVNEGLLEQISSSEGTDTYATPGVTVLTPEELDALGVADLFQ